MDGRQLFIAQLVPVYAYDVGSGTLPSSRHLSRAPNRTRFSCRSRGRRGALARQHRLTLPSSASPLVSPPPPPPLFWCSTCAWQWTRGRETRRDGEREGSARRRCGGGAVKAFSSRERVTTEVRCRLRSYVSIVWLHSLLPRTVAGLTRILRAKAPVEKVKLQNLLGRRNLPDISRSNNHHGLCYSSSSITAHLSVPECSHWTGFYPWNTYHSPLPRFSSRSLLYKFEVSIWALLP